MPNIGFAWAYLKTRTTEAAGRPSAAILPASWSNRERIRRAAFAASSDFSFTAPRKNSNPRLPVSRLAYSVQQLVVSCAVRFQIQAQVQDRLPQGSSRAQQECDEQTTQSAVPVEKR